MSSNTCPEHRGNFSIPYPTPQVIPLFHVPVVPHSTSLSTYHQQTRSFSCNALSLIPTLSAKHPRSKETNQTCLPAYSIIKSPTTPLPCIGILPVSVSLHISIYLSIHLIHHLSRTTRYSSSSANQQQLLNYYHQANHPQQINNNSLPTTTHASSNLIMLFYQVGRYFPVSDFGLILIS